MSTSSSSASTRNFVSMQNKYDRVILLVDMDCFFCQVEEKEDPQRRGKPLAVVQYNPWRGGGIIAVNYEARAKGVTRHMRGDEAKDLCPDIILCKVPNLREKADTSKYRDAGKEVANVLQRFTQLLERASVDEAYLDVTDAVNKRMEELQKGSFALQPQELVNTFAVGYTNIGDFVNKITNNYLTNPYIDDERLQLLYDHNDLPAVRVSDLRLLIGAWIAGEVRAAVKAETGYECSAGIAHNKILAKLAAGMNKPNKQTILPLSEIPALFDTLPVGKIKGLGGKFGEDVCERLSIKFLGQLLKYSEAELQRKLDEKNGSWLYNISRGIDLEAVTPRFYSKSIGCCKKFPGRNNITGLKTLQHWFNELASEISDRLEKDLNENNRKAKQMVVQFVQECDGEEVASSRSAPLTHYDQAMIAKNALDLVKTNTKTFFRAGSDTALNNPIKFLGISVGKFETLTNGQSKLQEMFANQAAKKRKLDEQEPLSKPQNEPEQKKPKESGQSKMMSFFANYLQKEKSDQKDSGTQPKVQDEKIQKQLLTDMVEVSTHRKGFFKEYNNSLKQATQKQDVVQEQQFIAPKDQSDPDIETLAAELDEIEAANASIPEPLGQEQSTTSIRDLNENSDQSSLNKDFKSRYVEYAQPELRLDLISMIKCDQCGTQIPDDPIAIQTHHDHHYAQELRRQLHAEQQKTAQKNKLDDAKGNLSTTSTSKRQNKTNSSSASSVNNIKKFLSAKVPTEPSHANMERCQECQAYINSQSMPEHMDYHVAKKLQRQLNQLEVRTVNVSSKKSPSTHDKKQHNATISSAGNKTIAQFFSQAN
ncbi:DNA polymerase eta [Scaptodrosophila lebanonensis]|uniref:DNA polymerase eta n=1 Tax=Drosophila lebanonensis TaxID=7225 RepID=A0A6J2U1H4_DROLE|nr:DNA polymerase eta [Scaptodrosophila lebanonensis]